MPDSFSFKPLDSHVTFLGVLDASQRYPVVIFKHSTSCFTSSYAYKRLQELTLESDPIVYLLIVQQSRQLSNEIASRFQVKHESPQILILYQGRVVSHTSHSRINVETIRDTVQKVRAENQGSNE